MNGKVGITEIMENTRFEKQEMLFLESCNNSPSIAIHMLRLIRTGTENSL
jgi:hypothetical protein